MKSSKKIKSTFQKSMEGLTAVFGAALVLCAILEKITSFEVFSVIGITAFTFFYHFAMRLIIGAIVPWISKKRQYDPEGRWFGQKSFEKKLYKKLNVKEWKDKMPTYSPETFSLEKHTLAEIIQNMCVSELVHEVIILFSFVPLLFTLMWGTFPVFLITSVLAAMFDSCFVMMQRYNRPRMVKLIERQQRSQRLCQPDTGKENVNEQE